MQVVNGTYYPDELAPDLVEVLEHVRCNNIRVRIYSTYQLGDFDEGYIARTIGPQKSLILLANSRSTGGPLLNEKYIVRIEHSNKKNGGQLYPKP